MSKFTRFNKNTRNFDIDGLNFRTRVDEKGKTVNVYLYAQQLFEEDDKKSVPHLVKAIYKNEFSEKIRQEYPDLPPYRYNLVVKMGEGDYVYVSAPVSMNDQFDEIMDDPSLIKEIQKDRCAISAYSFYSKRDNEWRYGLEFCE